MTEAAWLGLPWLYVAVKFFVWIARKAQQHETDRMSLAWRKKLR